MNEFWKQLTRSTKKRDLYARETYFREGLFDAQQQLGEQFNPAMREVALLLIKPDGLAAGKARTIVGFLHEHRYAITAVQPITMNRFHWRELWRYQLTSATLDRLAVNALVLERPSLLLLLRHEECGPIPGSVHLSMLKGPSGVAAQPPDCLRRRIGQPNRIFSFAHVSDEPADVLRELAILLDEPQRRRVLTSHANGRLTKSDEETLESALSAPVRSRLDASVALKRALDSVQRTSTISDALGKVRDALEKMRAGKQIRWISFHQALHESGVHLDEWDIATLGANFIIYDEPGQVKQIPGVDAASW